MNVPEDSSSSSWTGDYGGAPPERLFQELATPMLIVDGMCVVVAANGAARNLFPTAQQLIGAHFTEFWRTSDRGRLHEIATSLHRNPGSQRSVDGVRMLAGGRDAFPVNLVLTGLQPVPEPLILCEVLSSMAAG